MDCDSSTPESARTRAYFAGLQNDSPSANTRNKSHATPSTIPVPDSLKKRSTSLLSATTTKSTTANKKAKNASSKTSKPAKGKGSSKVKDEEPAIPKRGINFTTLEDCHICRAYVNCTSNGLVGNDQKAESFWKGVCGKFHQLLDDDEAIEVVLQRTWSSIRNRFQKHIAPTVQKWNRYFKQVCECPPSGTPENEWPQIAANQYRDDVGKPFQFLEASAILREAIPKFNPMQADYDCERSYALSEDSPIVLEDGTLQKKPPAVNNTTPAMGSNLQRPPGNKKLKQLDKDSRSLVSFKSRELQNQEYIISQGAAFVAQMKRANELKEYQLKKQCHNEEVRNYLKLIQMYEVLNKPDKAAFYEAELQKLMNRPVDSLEPPADPLKPPSTDPTPSPLSIPDEVRVEITSTAGTKTTGLDDSPADLL
jgi:hypothetical protein